MNMSISLSMYHFCNVNVYLIISRPELYCHSCRAMVWFIHSLLGKAGFPLMMIMSPVTVTSCLGCFMYPFFKPMRVNHFAK